MAPPLKNSMKCGIKPAAHLLLILVLPIFLAAAKAPKLCEALAVGATIQTKILSNGAAPFLKSIGYSPAVAERLAKSDLTKSNLTEVLGEAQKLADLDSLVDGLKPAQVYRGVSTSPQGLNYSYKNGMHIRGGAGKIFVSSSSYFAAKYAIAGELSQLRQTKATFAGLIMELEVPKSWLDKDADHQDNSVSASSMNDLRPFIRRVGVIRMKEGAQRFSDGQIEGLKSTEWFSFEAFVKKYGKPSDLDFD